MVAQRSGTPALDQEDIFTSRKSEVFQRGDVIPYPCGMWFNIPSHFLLLPGISLTLIGISSNSARETHRKLRSKARMDVLTQNVPANQGESQDKDPPLSISESGVFCLDCWLFSS